MLSPVYHIRALVIANFQQKTRRFLTIYRTPRLSPFNTKNEKLHLITLLLTICTRLELQVYKLPFFLDKLRGHWFLVSHQIRSAWIMFHYFPASIIVIAIWRHLSHFSRPVRSAVPAIKVVAERIIVDNLYQINITFDIKLLSPTRTSITSHLRYITKYF